MLDLTMRAHTMTAIKPSHMISMIVKERRVFRAAWPTFLAILSICSIVAADSDLYRADPAKIQGAENCAECHAPMVEAWKLTHHYSTYLTTHQGDPAKQIMSKLGVRRMKSESACVKCHYTSQLAEGSIKAISGISCESCHAAGTDWNKAHSDMNDPDRLAKAEKLGLIRPGNFYAVAANCFSCHTVPDEKLVNDGGHKAGSELELVAWIQGEVRHNLHKSNGKTNEDTPPNAKRMLYIVGRALDLEYGLRGLAKATQAGAYADAMTQRVKTAKEKLQQVQDALKSPDLKEILDAAASAELKTGNDAALTAAAEKVAAAAKRFSSSNKGDAFAAIDSLLPAASQSKGKVYTP